MAKLISTTMLLGAIAVLVGCGSEPRSSAPPPPDLARAFSHLPLPPEPQLVSKTGSPDALQLSVHSPADLAEVVAFYRKELSGDRWRLVSDRQTPDGATVLYAEQNGPPLWVRIWKPARGGTMVELTGAVVDSSKSKPSRSGSGTKPAR